MSFILSGVVNLNRANQIVLFFLFTTRSLNEQYTNLNELACSTRCGLSISVGLATSVVQNQGAQKITVFSTNREL